jgi:hypothetical protein
VAAWGKFLGVFDAVGNDEMDLYLELKARLEAYQDPKKVHTDNLQLPYSVALELF